MIFDKLFIERIVTIGFLLNASFCIFFGYISDIFTSKKVYTLGIISLLILTLLSNFAFIYNSKETIALFIVLMSVTLGACVGSVFNILASIFPIKIRTSALVLCLNTTNGLFIGLTPFLFTQVITATHFKKFPSQYISFLCILSLYFVFKNKIKPESKVTSPNIEKSLIIQLLKLSRS